MSALDAILFNFLAEELDAKWPQTAGCPTRAQFNVYEREAIAVSVLVSRAAARSAVTVRMGKVAA